MRLALWAAVIGALILLGRFERPYFLYGPDDALRSFLSFAAAAEGTLGLALVTLRGSGFLAARIGRGLLIGPATLLLLLGELGLARVIVRLATYRLGVLPEIKLRWQLA